ncbi:MAG: ATP-dependent helicase HrpB [Rhodobacteraceae bacterium]|nr:ATP-dependent helicase HrpB [Paracoccaceae bacterium]
MHPLPIDPLLPELASTLMRTGCVILQAPPGAGKTTRVPPALLSSIKGKILMLEPRRLAARGAALRIASEMGEEPGQTVGFRLRGESVPGNRIEIVTEGILTRMIQTDAELTGIGCVIFDEFHERSLHADLGLALTWEVRQALRDDLKIVVMSATLDAEPVAKMLGNAPVLTAEGSSFPVEVRHLPRPRGTERLETCAAREIDALAAQTDGAILCFLPGAGEIRRTAAALRTHVPVFPLYGALPFADQQKALKPTGNARVVLATSIAETSLTIEDVRVVVDGGLARRARFDPGSGFSRLVTERVTRAEAAQRTGRAGRVAEGLCLRLWTKGEEGALAAYPPAEIEAADLAPLALELAEWGSDEGDLAFLTPPPAPAMAEARALLTSLSALEGGTLTQHGRAMGRLPVHPRLGHMLLEAGKEAAPLAALLGVRDPVQSDEAALALRLEAVRDTKRFRRERSLQLREAALKDIKSETKRLARLAPDRPYPGDAVAAALAFPDRVGGRRPGDQPRFLLSGGKGAELTPGDSLAGAPWIIAVETDGKPRDARIRLAIPITEAEIRDVFASETCFEETCSWSRRESRVMARRRELLGALPISDQTWKDAPAEALSAAMCEGIRLLGLNFPKQAELLCARAIRAGDTRFEASALLDTLEDWLGPYLAGVTKQADWKGFNPTPALKAILSWEEQQALDQTCPEHYTTPLGRQIAIDYGEEQPGIALRLQELFGETKHPMVDRAPLLITLLSPAGRPVQTTADLPGFWAGSYADVRKDMRARYPKHPWPEDPTAADPTLRTKRRAP